MGGSDELVVLADSSKFSRRSSLVFCPLEDIDVLITDEGIPDAAAAMLEAAEVRLVVAELRSDRAPGRGSNAAARGTFREGRRGVLTVSDPARPAARDASGGPAGTPSAPLPGAVHTTRRLTRT